MSSLKERYEVAAAEGAAARREREALRGALASVESRLSEYKLKDAEVWVAGAARQGGVSQGWPGSGYKLLWRCRGGGCEGPRGRA